MKKDRALLVSLAVFLVALAAFHLRQSGPGAGWMPACAFRGLTGLECPGCGMTRGVHALLHGRIGEAFLFNPLGMFLLPVAVVGLSLELFGWVRERPSPVRIRLGKRGLVVLFFVVIGYGVARNLV